MHSIAWLDQLLRDERIGLRRGALLDATPPRIVWLTHAGGRPTNFGD